MSIRTGPLRRSKRLASVIPASHWRRLGHTASESNALEVLQIRMKDPHRGEGVLSLESPHRVVDAEGRVLRRRVEHNDLMLPHWEKFARMMRQHSEEKPMSVDFRSIHLPRAVLETIMPSMQSIRVLSLAGCGLGSIGFRLLCSYLRDNSSLTVIGIFWDYIDVDAAISFSGALNKHPTLEDMWLGRCNLDDAVVLKEILAGCHRLERLKFPGSKIGSASASVIADYIGKNHPQTTVIDLSDNQISDVDVPDLVHSFRNNDSIRTLNLRRNQFTNDGKEGMTKAVLDATDVTSIVQSNHSSIFRFETEYQCRFLDQLEVLSINQSKELRKEQKIRKKVLFALCRRPEMLSNLLHYCDYFPLGLVWHLLKLIQQLYDPHFLKLMQQQEGLHRTELFQRQYDPDLRALNFIDSETAGLSRLFLTLRKWRMPLLFENVHRPAKTATRMNGKRKRNRFR